MFIDFRKFSKVAEASATSSKPVLKGLHHATIKRNLIVSGILVVLVTTAYKVFVNDPKKARYAEFYKHYDAKKSFERMKDAGLLQSCSK